MKGLVLLGDERAEVRDVPRPEVEPGWALIKVKVSGVCGSDLHFYHTPAAEMGKETGPRPGMVVGHEAAGMVETVGDCVEKVKPGDRVIVSHHVSCGTCHYCRSGAFQFCAEHQGIAATGNGSAAEYLTAPARNCLPLPDELSYATGAMMACCAATAFSALYKLNASGLDELVIFGLGPVGLSALLEAQAMGVRVIGVEVEPYRLDLAQRLGADVVIDGRETDVVAAIRDLTHGRGATRALETSGSAAGRRQMVSSLALQGKGVFVGIGAEGPLIDPSDLIDTERTLMGSYVLPVSLYRPLAEFLVDRAVDLDRIVTHRFPLEQGVEAFEVFDTRKTGKVVLEID